MNLATQDARWPAPIVSQYSVAVIMINWNGAAMTIRAVEALRQSCDAHWHLVLVDNASTDDSVECLSDLGADVTLIVSPANEGWTGGNNRGIDWAISKGYQWLFILNNDALVENDTIARLQVVQRADETLIVGPIHLDGSGKRYDFVGTDCDARTGLPVWKSVDDKTVSELPDLVETKTIKGAGIMVRSAQFQRIGPFDQRFFLNFDETDWCYRASLAGYRLKMVKSARIRHLGSGSIGGSSSPLQAYFLARNSLLFARLHCSIVQRAQMMRNLWWEARDLPRANPSRRGWFWRLLVRPSPAQRGYILGVFDFLRGRFGDCPPLIRALNKAPFP